MSSYSDNRELSWLKFNCRVLEEAEDDSVPLFERLGFVSIFASNLDEFFGVRVGALCSSLEMKKSKAESALEQLSEISEKLDGVIKRYNAAYRTVMGRLSDYGIVHLRPETCSDADKEFLRNRFATAILPYLSPEIADKKKQLFAENKTVYLLAKLKDSDGKEKYALVPVRSEFFGRVIFLENEGRHRFVLTEDVIAHFAQLIFTDYTVCDRAIIRFTRSADIDMDSAYDSENLEKATEKLIEKRTKLPPTRLEYSRRSSRDFVVNFAKSAGILFGGRFIYFAESPMDYGFTDELSGRVSSNSELFYDRLSPRRSPMFDDGESIMKQIEQRDRMLMYPYESMEPFLKLLEEAAENPEVISIKITLYRVAKESRLIDSLIRAAENGKDVTAVIELRARFDEAANLAWSERLRQAGVHVFHGPHGYKVHSKLLLIIKQNGNGISYITQVGTGNYNEKTAKRYTDMIVMTADSVIGGDAFTVFNALSLNATPGETRQLLAAPSCMKSRIISMIDAEAALGSEGYIGMKLNALTDKDIIAHLAEASKRGAKTELIIRGASCLVAGVRGETENISLVSVVGSFLEHSRIYVFGRGGSRGLYISSADMMTRNLDRRVEIGIPVNDEAVRNRILDYFNITFNDGIKARVQHPDGIYRRRQRTVDAVNSQAYFYRQAYENEKPLPEKKAEKKVQVKKEPDKKEPEKQEIISETQGMEQFKKLSFWQKLRLLFSK